MKSKNQVTSVTTMTTFLKEKVFYEFLNLKTCYLFSEMVVIVVIVVIGYYIIFFYIFKMIKEEINNRYTKSNKKSWILPTLA